MRRWIGVGLLLALGLLTGCGGGSSTPQSGPKPKMITEKVIDKEGNVTERITFPGPEGFQKRRKTSGK